ncbi:MAG: PDZ domain-containing protein, partial [Proteobacteria bacterium]|nr:PDZ domain-containing protein [Pseudomonadota bacterium]
MNLKSVPVGILSLTLLLTAPEASRAQNLEKGFSDLAKKVSRGVVNISTFARPKFSQRGAPPEGFTSPFDQGDPFGGLFGDFFGAPMIPRQPERPAPKAPKNMKPQPFALGTGFVIDESGLILTNHHVINEAEEVKIQFNEDDDYTPAEIIGRDPELDVALLSVKTKEKLTVLPLGDSDKIEVGEYVLAVGNPLGYGHSVTHGILSAKERKAPEMRLAKYLQTDASINPGNSGGPLINMRGEVIGINNAIDARAQGIGFAIPVNSVKLVLGQLKSKGTVSRGYLGISAGEISPDLAESLKLPKGTKGVLVAEVIPDQAAAKAGIKPYDVITQVNDDKILSPVDLTTRITAIPVGGSAEITLIRKGAEKKITLTVGERPTDLYAKSGNPPRPMPKKAKKTDPSLKTWGFDVVELTEANARGFGIPPSAAKDTKGVIVSELSYGKPAAEAGLARGDLLIDVAGKEITSIASAETAIKAEGKQSLMIRVKRFTQN